MRALDIYRLGRDVPSHRWVAGRDQLGEWNRMLGGQGGGRATINATVWRAQIDALHDVADCWVAPLPPYDDLGAIAEDIIAEAPEHFADAYHLNEQGRIQFTSMLAAALLDEGSDR